MKISIEIDTEDPVEVKRAVLFLEKLLSIQHAYEPEEPEVVHIPLLKESREHVVPEFSKLVSKSAEDFLKEADDENEESREKNKEEDNQKKKEEKSQAPAKQSTTVRIIDEEF